jgi:hypothetical protein
LSNLTTTRCALEERANNLRANSACICSSQTHTHTQKRFPLHSVGVHVPTEDPPPKAQGCIKLVKMRHAMIKVASWVAVCSMIDADTDYYMLISHQPLYFITLSLSCSRTLFGNIYLLFAVIACNANSSWLCSSATGLLNGSNGEASCTGWRRRQHQIFPNKSVSQAVALDEGMATARCSDSGLRNRRRQRRFHQDLGYNGPWVCAACVSFSRDIVGSAADGTYDLTAGWSRATRLQRIWFRPICALCSAMFISGDN